MSKAPAESLVPTSTRRSGLPRLTSHLSSILSSRSSNQQDPQLESTDPIRQSPLSRFQPLALKRVFSSHKDRNTKETSPVSEQQQTIGCSKSASNSCTSWVPPLQQKTQQTSSWQAVSPVSQEEHFQEAWRDDSSTFSKQLAKITTGSDEDFWGSCNPCLSGPRPAWPGDGSHGGTDNRKLSKDCVGRKVLIGGREEGILKYFGRTAFASGLWCGIELENAVGKHDGSVDGVIYFSCSIGHGIFAPDNKVSLLKFTESEVPMKRAKYGTSSGKTIYRLSAGSSSSSSGMSDESKRSSGASSATYTIIGRTETSLPSTPEDFKAARIHKNNSLGIDEGELGHELISPGDETYDDSSLGILSPDQMPDFTATGSASMERSPSDDEIAALEDEICDEIGAVGGSESKKRSDSEGSISGMEEEIIQNDISAIIRELKRKEADNSSASVSPNVPNTAIKENAVNEPTFVCDKSVRSKIQSSPVIKDKSVKFITDDRFEVPVVKQLDQLKHQSCIKFLKKYNDVEATEWQSDGTPDMTLSAASLDQGYQGDGEFDVPSEAGSVTASSPIEESRMFENTTDLDQMVVDSHSSAVTDAEISLDDDEIELESGIMPRDRLARIIDGKLYHNNRELVSIRQVEGRQHDAHLSEMDSSGFYSDLDPRDEDSARLEFSSLQPLRESKLDGDLQDSVLDDIANEDDEMMEYATVTKGDPDLNDFQSSSHEKNDKEHSNEDSSLIDEEERSSTSTIRSESKDISSSEHIPSVPSDSSTATKLDGNNKQELPQTEKCSHSSESKLSSFEEHTERLEIETNENFKSTSQQGSFDSDDVTSSKSEQDCGSSCEPQVQQKPRNYEKPWLSKPPTPRKVEKPKILLPPPPPMPKKNVQSKLKALLEASAEASVEERKPRLPPKKGRWDDVMSRIEEGKKEEKVRPKVREVKSRLMDALKVPQSASPQVEKIRQERKERRERRERQVAAAAVARKISERKRSNAGISKTSRAPSLDSLGFIAPIDSRASTPEMSQHSSSSSLSTSGGPPTPVGSRIGVRGSRVPPSRTSSRLSVNTNGDEKRCPELLPSTNQSSRRSKIDNKSTQSKNSRSHRKISDPVKILRSAAPNVGPQSRSPVNQCSEQLKKLESELSSRNNDLKTAKEETTKAARGVEALTVLVHYLVKEYDAFSTPQLKSDIERLCGQLSNVQLSLDETTASARRLEDEVGEKAIEYQKELTKLQEKNISKLDTVTQEHQRIIEQTKEKHNLELREEVTKEEIQRDQLIKCHEEELETIDCSWRSQVEMHHERHLQALEQLNTCHTKQIKDAEAAWEAKEKELHEENGKLVKEQTSLKHQKEKLEESLLSDKDHRLQAAKNVCTSLRKEVDSLKTVVEMRNTEVHKLRDQLTDRERLIDDLEAARERMRSLQAKTEDLNARMEQKCSLERQLLADQHMLTANLQRESCSNKRLSLENEELQWKLRQREAMMAADNLPTSTLDLVTRCSPLPIMEERPSKSGGSSPMVTPRSQRSVIKSQLLKSDYEKRWTQSFGNIPEVARKLLKKNDIHEAESMAADSPPTSPRVKSVIEKSNSVSFILDLDDTFPEEPFLGMQSSPLLRKPRTPTLCRKHIQKNFNNILEKSKSSTVIRNGREDVPHCMTKSLSLRKNQKVYREDNRMCRSVEDSKGLFINGSTHYSSNNGRGHSTSESSDDVEIVSPNGMAWSVPIHDKQRRFPSDLKNIPNRFQVVPYTPSLLQQPDEDEYEEEIENEFVEVLTLEGGEDLNSAPLTTLFAQTPSTSVSLTDSDISQCGSRGDLSSDDEDCTDEDEEGTQIVPLPEDSLRPQEGAGEAMIIPDAFALGSEHKGSAILKETISKSQISSAPSSDSEEPNNQNLTEDESALNTSWSEDCDLTSSSELQEL